jgi:hypothetical protein
MGTVGRELAETGRDPAVSRTGYGLVAGGLAMPRLQSGHPGIGSSAGCSVGDR